MTVKPLIHPIGFYSCILNAKRKAHNFRFDFHGRAAPFKIEFIYIYTREYTWHPPTNTLNVLRVQISLKAQSQIIKKKNNGNYCES